MKTINIKGKPYVTVNERVMAFRNDPKYQGYRMVDDVIDYSDSFILIKTTIFNENGDAVATGIAQEYRDASNINKTSYVENCETSAWGRALGNLGIGIDASIASAEETQTAINNQEKQTEKINKNAIDAIKLKADEKGVALSGILDFYHLNSIEDMTVEQWINAMRKLDKN